MNGASIGTETITLTDPNASTANPPLTLAITNWSVNDDPAEPKRFEYQASHIDNNPTNHVYIYQAILGTYTTEEWTIQFKNDSTNGLGWYDHGSANPTDTNHGNGTFLYTSWDGGNDNCIVQNDDFFINYTLPPPASSSTTYNLDSNDTPIITPSSGDWSSWAEYRYRSDDVLGYVYYDLWNTGAANGGGFSYDENDNTNNDGGYQIRVSKTTGDWSDYPHTGTHPPTGVSTTNGNVALGTLFTFVKPSGTGQTPWMSDPNTSTPTYPNTLDVVGGNWGATTFTLQSTSTTDEIIYWKADDTAGTTAIYYKVSESKWYDGSSGGQPTAFSINDGTPSDPSAVVSAGDSVKLTAGSSGNYGSFTMFST